MKITSQKYEDITKQHAPKSHIVKNCFFAFLIGGLICMIGQILINIYLYYGMDQKSANTLCSIVLIFLSALLTGFNVYGKIANFAGAGTLVPITGFANSVVAPALEFQTEGLILGVASQMFIIAGPVIVYGSIASVILGVIVFIIGI